LFNFYNNSLFLLSLRYLPTGGLIIFWYKHLMSIDANNCFCNLSCDEHAKKVYDMVYDYDYDMPKIASN